MTKMYCSVSTALALVTALSGAPASADPIPAGRRTNWTHTGVPGGIPNRTRICATFSPGATASQINSALSSCSSSGGGVVMLSAGTYNITGIQIYASNVTLRGAGADQTILRGGNIMNLGNGGNTASSVSITGGGAFGTHTFTVSSASSLRVNQMIELDRDDDPSVVVSTTGGSRYMRQVNLITAISGNTVTVKNPLFIDFTAGNPRIRHTFSHTSMSGVEDLKLDHSAAGSGTNFNLQYCYGCWVKGVESYKPAGYHFVILGTLNLEVRDSYIHDAQTYGANNGGLAFYGSSAYGSNSSAKIENNIFDRLFPAVELQNSSSGFYIGYNYFNGSQSQSSGQPVTWTMADNHGPHDMMNLWEGNIGEMYGSDGYFGGSSHGTAARNYITGYNPLSGSRDNPIRLNRLSYYYNVVGNVLGSSSMNPNKYSDTQEGCGGACTGIYRLGYPNIGNASLTDVTGHSVPGGMTYPDVKVAATLLRWGNYDYFNDTVRWNTSEIPSGVPLPTTQTIPASYYYSARPSWFPSSVAWPPIGPEVTGGTADAAGKVHKIPAQRCWEARNLAGGGAFNAASCWAGTTTAPPAAPTNVRIIR